MADGLWRYLPTDILDLEKAQKTAQDWADQQRAQLAQNWADLHRQATDALLALYGPEQPQPEAAPTYSGPSATDLMTKAPESEPPLDLGKGYTGQPEAAVAPERDQAPDQGPEPPGIGSQTMLNLGPFGMRSPLSPPIQRPSLGPPDEEAAQTMAETGAPIKGIEDIIGSGARTATEAVTAPGAFDTVGGALRTAGRAGAGLLDSGKVGQFVGRQGQSQPGAVGDVVTGEEALGRAVRHQEERGGFGGALGAGVRAAGEVGGGAGMRGVGGFSRPVDERQQNFLRDSVLAHIDDPRPEDRFNDPGLPRTKAVFQQHLAELLPEGATLYHETSVPGARGILQRVEAGPRGQSGIFTSENPDLALGQGGRGVVLEFDPTLVNGSKVNNPAKVLTDLAGEGAEYTISKSLRGAVQAIVVSTQRQADQLARDPLIAKRFDFANPTPVEGGFRIARRASAPAADGPGLTSVNLLAAPQITGAVAGGALRASREEPQREGESDEAYAARLAGAAAIGGVTGAVGAGIAANPRARQALRDLVSPRLGITPSAGDAHPGTAVPGAEVERLRLDKFPEAVRDTIQRAATEGDFWRTQRRGVIPDVQAESMADDLGRTVDQMIAKGKAGASYNTEETRALRNAVTSQAMTVNELSAEIARAPHEAAPGLIARSVAEGMKLADLTRVAEGARAEAGRTFRAYQDFTRDYAANPAGAVERIFKSVGGAENATKAVQEYQQMLARGANPAQMAAFWARAEKPPPGFTDWWELLRRNSMLSGPRTLVINALSGATEIPWKLAGDALESTLRGRPQEIVPEVRAIWAGLQRGSENAMQTLAHGITNAQALAGDMPRDISSRLTNPVAKGTALALEAPMRAQQATDDVAQSIAYSMALARHAAVTASREGARGQAWTERVADLMAQPTPAMMALADRTSQEMTFKGEMGALGTALGQLQKVPIAGPAIIPFLRTVYHITSRGIDRSPLGLFGTAFDVARGVYGRGKEELAQSLRGERPELPKGVRQLDQRFRDNAMGSAAALWFYSQAAQGNVTGSGPDDPEKKAMLTSQGWQPYAVKIGGDYVSYSNWGPVAVPLALAAGAAEAQIYAKPGAPPTVIVGDALQRSAKMLTEQNYLQGVGAVYKSMTDFERYGHQWLTQYLSSLVPYGAAINTVGQATDPLVRQPAKGDVGQALAVRFPGLREGVPAKQDVLGRDVVNEQQGLASANPLRTSEGRPSEALGVLLENRADIPAVPKDIKNVPLTPEDQRRFQQIAGERVEAAVTRIVADERFPRLASDVRTKLLQHAIEQARETASGLLFKELGSAEIKRRLLEKQAAGVAR